MRIEVEDSVDSLCDELIRSDEIRRYGRPTVHRNPIPPGKMGAAGGWIDLVVGSGLDLTAVVVAVAAWLRPRQPQAPAAKNERTTKVVIRHGDIEISLTEPTAAAIVETVRAWPADP